jgi:Kef-type K+ transport system membrane component KefB
MIDFFELFALSFQRPIENPVLIFSLMLFIILLSPIILRKFKIPGIIGLIISGVLIGPYGFGLLENDSSIKLFSTIGLLYIMFLAIRFRYESFKSTGNKSLLFGFFTFTIPLVLGFPV